MFSVQSRTGLARALVLVAAACGETRRAVADSSGVPAQPPPAAPDTARHCLRYEPDTVRLSGTLKVEQRYGPPNYGETPAKDERLRVTFLNLAAPINVCGRTTGEDNRESLSGVRQVQLNLAKLRTRPAIKPGQTVTIRGTLYHGFSGYHFTDAVMNVSALESRP